jgi:hypothetical protein
MLEIRKIYDPDGIGSDFDRWQRRYRYFMVLHVGAARDLLGHLGHHAWNGAVETTRLLRGQSPDEIAKWSSTLHSLRCSKSEPKFRPRIKPLA